MKTENTPIKRIVRVKNKYTGDCAYFEYEDILDSPRRDIGLMVKQGVKECAYKLGCDESELIIL